LYEPRVSFEIDKKDSNYVAIYENNQEYMVSDFLGRLWRPSLRMVDMLLETQEVFEKILRQRKVYEQNIDSNLVVKLTRLVKSHFAKYLLIIL